MGAGSDGTIKVRSALKDWPLYTLEPSGGGDHYIYCAQWSPTRPCIVTVGSRNSQLHLYDLQDPLKPTTLEAGDDAPVLALAFNDTNCNLLATGDGRGTVKVWQLSQALSTPTKDEDSLIATPAHAERQRKDRW